MSSVLILIIILFLKLTDSCPSSTETKTFAPQSKSSSVPRIYIEKPENSNIEANKIDHSLTSMETSSLYTSTVTTSTLPQPPFDFAQLTHTCEDKSKALHSLTVSIMTKCKHGRQKRIINHIIRAAKK